eukprot:3013605-Amphidinium_carterae.1
MQHAYKHGAAKTLVAAVSVSLWPTANRTGVSPFSHKPPANACPISAHSEGNPSNNTVAKGTRYS